MDAKEDHGVDGEKYCDSCEGKLTFISQYDKWYCYNCKKYHTPKQQHKATKDVVPQRTNSKCSTCGDTLFFIPNYDAHFCYRCNAYSDPDPVTTPVSDKGGEVQDVKGYQTPEVAGPVCPDCGTDIEDDWIRCPNCGSLLGGEMNERPVTTPDDRPDDALVQNGPALEEEDVTVNTTDSTDRTPWSGRHDGEYKWVESAANEGHDQMATSSEASSERDMGAQEERARWEESASAQSKEWRRSAHDETEAREIENAPVKTEPEIDTVPDGHSVEIDQEVEFLVDIFEEILSCYLNEPMEPVSFYRSKLKYLSNKSPIIRKMNVGEDGIVRIYVEKNDFGMVLDEMTNIFDALVETESKISDQSSAMARAKLVLEPIVEEYEEELEDFGIIHKLFKGAFATKLPSGIPGFDDMLLGGIPNGASIILQGAAGGEKEMFANQFLSEGLRCEGSMIISLTMISPSEWRTQMKSIGTKVRKFEKEGQIVIVDWYTHKNERVRSVEVKGSVILSSKSLTNLEIAIDKSIKKIRNAPTKRAVISILSPAIKALGFDKVFGFAQSIRGKFKKYGITGLFLLEKKMHDERVESSLHSVFDGVFDIERQRIRDSMVRKIGILSLKGRPFESDYRELELSRSGLTVKAKNERKDGPFGQPLRY